VSRPPDAAAHAHAGPTMPDHDCPLCGYRFDEGAAHCGGCPLNQKCGTVCCPRCGYEFVDRSATVDWLRRLTRRAGHILGRVMTPARRS